MKKGQKMDLDHYQRQAHRTRKIVNGAGSDAIVPILGLAGEAGELLNEYKKKLRDGDAHTRFRDRVAEELGDILWYVAETATVFGIDLSEIALKNLAKTRARWGIQEEGGEDFMGEPYLFDVGFPEDERLPRQFEVEFRQCTEEDRVKTRLFVEGQQMGNTLTDNAHIPDGYRFHDVFHLACAAVLGWSPTSRRILNLKRRSDPKVDEVEDGGRAIVTEEGISALVFGYAKEHDGLEEVRSVDYYLLKAIRIMTTPFEVAVCTTGEWERTILSAYEVWKQVEENQGGKVQLDLDKRTIKYLGQAQMAAPK